jgi:hypothetical protein
MKMHLKIIRGLVGIRFLKRVNKRCPAIMLAAKRTERVIGRMMLLIISMRTMKGIRGAGVPKGTKCAKKFVMLLANENIMKPNQRGRARERVIVRWLVEVKE